MTECEWLLIENLKLRKHWQAVDLAKTSTTKHRDYPPNQSTKIQTSYDQELHHTDGDCRELGNHSASSPVLAQSPIARVKNSPVVISTVTVVLQSP